MNQLKTSEVSSSSKRCPSKVINQLHKLQIIDQSKKQYEIQKIVSSRRLKAVNRLIHIDQDDSYLMSNWHKTMSAHVQSKDHTVSASKNQDHYYSNPAMNKAHSLQEKKHSLEQNDNKNANICKLRIGHQFNPEQNEIYHSNNIRNFTTKDQKISPCLFQIQKSQTSTEYRSVMQSRMSESCKTQIFPTNYLTALITDEKTYSYCFSCDQFDSGISHTCVRKLTNLQEIYLALVRISQMIQCLKLTQYNSFPQMINKCQTYNELNMLYQFLKAKRDREPKDIPQNQVYILKRLTNVCGKKMGLLI